MPELGMPAHEGEALEAAVLQVLATEWRLQRGERTPAAGADPLKLDLRCYAYRGQVLGYAARM